MKSITYIETYPSRDYCGVTWGQPSLQRCSMTTASFLVSFEAGETVWSLLAVREVDRLPAVKWGQENLAKLSRRRSACANTTTPTFLCARGIRVCPRKKSGCAPIG